MLFVVLSVNSVAQSFTFNSYPGCFTGPRRSSIKASVKSGASFSFIDNDKDKQESINVGTSQQVRAIIEKLSKLELSEEEVKIWRKHGMAIGPGYYAIEVELADRSWRVHYPAFILDKKDRDRYEYDKATLKVIDKLIKMHNMVFALLPKKVADKIDPPIPQSAPQSKSK